MTNKLEISRELLTILADLNCPYDQFMAAKQRAAEILAAPVVERQPVAYRCRHSADEPWFFSDKPGYWEWQPLYAEQPAPVAAALLREAYECGDRNVFGTDLDDRIRVFLEAQP